ncbi:calcium/sodium antiporter [Candidatus Poriferisodalis sp.]|uniref:calcium/sodium antiporter n=1 Tax=Candidatus Poriferisodalis sp. TaxID=3101277 RepID=UPI003B022992
MILALLALLAGMVLLVWAGDRFVAGASRLATALRMRPAVIGAVVLGFGTSAPEMVVSSVASINGNPALGVGNIVGSNVANLSLGLGVAALLMSIPFSDIALRRDVPWSVATAAIFALLVVDGHLSRLEGGLLAVLLALTLVWVIRTSRDDDRLPDSGGTPGSLARDAGAAWRNLARAVLGLFGVIVGAQLAVEGATALAERWGLSGGFIGFSVVAVGTSLPELATVVAAARKGHTELIVGNLFGSNVFNSLAVGGAMGLVGAGAIEDPSLTGLGIGAMMAVVVLAYLGALIGKKASRIDGVVLLGIYIAAMILLGTR